ncbi:MAG: cell wall hydrolase [Clostridia bacterium]|nr:cell wall hydrolase [Clostridia bacterium]
MRKWIAIIALAALLVCVLAPHVSFTEDRDTVLLARAIYALARNESYGTKLAIGTVAMNRLESVWFADDLGSVLNEQHQFPIGSRYDAESLRAAHAVLSGTRALSGNALYYQSLSASQPRADAPLATVGGYAFYG